MFDVYNEDVRSAQQSRNLPKSLRAEEERRKLKWSRERIRH